MAKDMVTKLPRSCFALGGRTGGPGSAHFEKGHLKAEGGRPNLAHASRSELSLGEKGCLNKFLFIS